MKKIMMMAVPLLMGMAANAQKTIQLPTPDLQHAPQTSLVQVLTDRHSVREYADRQLDEPTLSLLLWAACGVNRPAEGRITAPSAMNLQDCRVYVCRADGAWLYDAKQHALTLVSSEDLRPAVAGPQKFAEAAPVSLVLVSDQTNFGKPDSNVGNIDAGYVSQNIYLACTAFGLGTVARMTMDKEALSRALQLTDRQFLIVNHPVGYVK